MPHRVTIPTVTFVFLTYVLKSGKHTFVIDTIDFVSACFKLAYRTLNQFFGKRKLLYFIIPTWKTGKYNTYADLAPATLRLVS